MSWKEWAAVAVVIGGGILLQIPTWGGHSEHHAEDGHDHASAVAASAATAAENGDRAVGLAVTGMT